MHMHAETCHSPATATVQLLQINQYGDQLVPPLPTVPDDRSTNTAAVPQEENDGDGAGDWVLGSGKCFQHSRKNNQRVFFSLFCYNCPVVVSFVCKFLFVSSLVLDPHLA